MQIQRQSIQRQGGDFAPLTRRTDRTTTQRSGAFDAILARQDSVRRQDFGGGVAERQNLGAAAPSAAAPMGRGDAGSTGRLTALTPGLLSPFPSPTMPPTMPPASLTPPLSTAAPAPAPAPAPVSIPPLLPPVATTRPPAANTSAQHPAIEALRGALTAMQMPFAGMDMEYSEQVVGFPGGSYVNRLITVRNPEGKTESFDAGLTMKDPRIAALDMARFLNWKV
jgi:hypothetical protein